MKYKTKWIIPLVFFQIYLGVTVFLYKFGAWPWDSENQDIVVIYLLFAQLLIGLGYSYAWKYISSINVNKTAGFNCHKQALSFIKFALIANLALSIFTSLSRTGAFFPDVLYGISNPGLSYSAAVERTVNGSSFVYVEYLRIILAPWLIGLFPVAVVYWAFINRYLKITIVAILLFNVSIYIATGVNKGIADIVITLPWLILLKRQKLRLIRKKNLLSITCLVLLIVAMLLFFGDGQAQREGGVGLEGALDTGHNGLIYVDRTGFFATYLDDKIVIIYESITRYLTSGYYALSLSFNIESSSTYGVGNSMFLARNANSIFETNYFTEQSIPGLIESVYGWSMQGLWHSIYPWLISDFGYLGALLVVLIFGYLLGLFWGASLYSPRPIYIIVVYYLLIILYYVPGNNQVMQSGEGLFGFISSTCYAIYVIAKEKSAKGSIIKPGISQFG